jgi:hypothetical protein
MKVTLYLLGAVLVLVGVFSMLQDLDAFTEGIKSDNSPTALLGEAIAVMGVVAVFAGFHAKKKRR